jgi:hypothetical protein
MPRRPAEIERDIPLFLIPHTVMQAIHLHREDLERVIVRKTRCHFYNVSIRTRPIRRERKGSETGNRKKRPKRGRPDTGNHDGARIEDGSDEE